MTQELKALPAALPQTSPPQGNVLAACSLYFLLLISPFSQCRHFPPISFKPCTVLLRKKKKKKNPSQPHTFNFLISMPARKVFLQLLEAATKNGPDCVCLKIGTLIPRLNRGWGLWSCWGGPWHSICQGAPQFVLPPPFFGASQDFAVGNFMRC